MLQLRFAIQSILLMLSLVGADASAGVFGEGSEPITLLNTDPMVLGTLITSQQGQITITPRGHRQASLGIDSLRNTDQARFFLQGQPGASFEISLPQQATLRNPTGSVIRLVDFRSEPRLIGQFDRLGRAVVRVGATLVVPNQVKGGGYRGDINVEFDYLP